MVPVAAALSAGTLSAVPLRTWAACAVAFAGVIIMGADGADGAADASSSVADAGAQSFGEMVHLPDADSLSALQLSQGDLLIVLAAVAYTMHVVRLGAYAPRTRPLDLAASKASTEAVFSVLLVAVLAAVGFNAEASSSPQDFVVETARGVSDYLATISASIAKEGGTMAPSESVGVSVAAVLWTGWVTCAYTIYAQSFGQRRVGPTDSNLIYTTQPLFSSMFAYFLLGETLGVYGYVGAALIGTALWLVSSSSSPEDDKVVVEE